MYSKKLESLEFKPPNVCFISDSKFGIREWINLQIHFYFIFILVVLEYCRYIP